MKVFSTRRIAVRSFVLVGAIAGISAAVAQMVELPEAAGKEMVLGACIDCHGADTVVKTRRSPEEWTAVVERMIGYGAALSSEEQAVVVSYLSTNLGPAAGSGGAAMPPVSSPEQAPAPSEPSPTPPAADLSAKPKSATETPKR